MSDNKWLDLDNFHNEYSIKFSKSRIKLIFTSVFCVAFMMLITLLGFHPFLVALSIISTLYAFFVLLETEFSLLKTHQQQLQRNKRLETSLKELDL